MQHTLKQSATKDAPVYFLAGGYEFVQYLTQTPPSHKRLEFMAKAFDVLHHDLLFVTPAERAVLAKAGVKPRGGWLGSEHLEQHILHSEGGPRVGVILLPPLPPTASALPSAMVRQVEDAVRSLRATTKLVVAMSPWGYGYEQELLKTAGPLPDILLGSGPGIGLTGNIAAEGKTVWIRAFTQGKSVSRIEILALPEHNSNFKWTEEKNIRMTLFGLIDQYQEDPQMLSLMQSMGTD